MVDPLDRDVERARQRRLLAAGCGLALGFLILLAGLVGLASAFGSKRSAVAEALGTPGATSTVQALSTVPALSSPTSAATSAVIPTVTPFGTPANGAAPSVGGTPPASATNSSLSSIPTITPNVPSPTPAPPTNTPNAPSTNSSPAPATNTPLPTSPRTETPASPSVAPVQSVRREGNGPDLNAPYVGPEPVDLNSAMDLLNGPGVSLIYPNVGLENWKGPQDQSGQSWIGWNEKYLYFAAMVNDDVHVQTQTSWNMYKGDSVELWIDADLAGDFNQPTGDADDWQFGFSAGDFRRLSPEGVVYIPRRDRALNAQIQVVAQPMGNGYMIEARVPWSMMGVKPSPGLVLGWAVDLSDNDIANTALQQTQVASNPNFKFDRPRTFGNLVLQGR